MLVRPVACFDGECWVERAMGIEPTSLAWEARVIAIIRRPRRQRFYRVLGGLESIVFTQWLDTRTLAGKRLPGGLAAHSLPKSRPLNSSSAASDGGARISRQYVAEQRQQDLSGWWCRHALCCRQIVKSVHHSNGWIKGCESFDSFKDAAAIRYLLLSFGCLVSHARTTRCSTNTNRCSKQACVKKKGDKGGCFK